MAYIVVGIAIWLFVGVAVALLLGRAMRVAEFHERQGRSWRRVNDPTLHTASRVH